MKKSCSWVVAVAGLLGLAGSSHAGSPALYPQVLPHLFAQEAPRPQTRPDDDWLNYIGHPHSPFGPGESLQTWERQCPTKDVTDLWLDDDWLADLLDCCGFTQYLWEPLARMLLPAQPVLPPFDFAADAMMRYVSAVAAAKQAAAEYAAPSPPAAVKEGPSRTCEVLPQPKTVSGPSSCPLSYGCPLGCGGVGQCAPCPSTSAAEVKGGSSFGSCPATKSCGVPYPTYGEIITSPPVVSGKACKCCKDCKDCECCKDAPPKGAYSMHSIIWQNAHPWTPVAMPPLPPLPPHPLMLPMLPPPPGMHETPLSPLQELYWQHHIIEAAINQMEQELALKLQAAAQQRIVYSQVATSTGSAHKVHLVTEHFEAHCNSMHCVGSDPHRLLLEGEVLLTCKKSGHFVRIEAPCVAINMKDGTFSVESQPAPQPLPAVPHNVHGMYPTPSAPIMLWTSDASWPSSFGCYSGPTPLPMRLLQQGWQLTPPATQSQPYPVIPAAYPSPASPTINPSSIFWSGPGYFR
jgi:hypothetical protein